MARHVPSAKTENTVTAQSLSPCYKTTGPVFLELPGLSKQEELSFEDSFQLDFKAKIDAALSSSVMKSFWAGALSGSVSTILLQPLDVLKTRLQSAANMRSKHGMVTIVLNVIQQEKLVGLWAGLWPSLLRCAPGVGLYFSTLHMLQHNFGSSDPRALESLAMGMSARSISGIILLPITVMKTRYEPGMGGGGLSMSERDIYHSVVQPGLYSGLTPTLLRDVPFSGLYLMFYSRIKFNHPSAVYGQGFEPLVDFGNGVLAGGIASMVTQPADVVKTRMQLCPSENRYLRQVLIHIYQEGGLMGFWCGLVPRMLRRTLMAALSWTVFEDMTRRYILKE